MEHETHLLDIPDEILLIILKKLRLLDVLYSLSGVNKRLDRIAKDTVHNRLLDFSIISHAQYCPVDDAVLDRFCAQILPQIHQHLTALAFDQLCMERLFLACQYPNLRIINIINYQPDMISEYLIGGSSIARLFREQITHIYITSSRKVASNESITDGCARLFDICQNLIYFNISQFTTADDARLALYGRPPSTCFSSQLRTLFVRVTTFDDCLCLLDGRLNQLTSFTIHIDSISRSETLTDHTDLLPNLTEFSMTSYPISDAYGCRILPLLRRMSNLEVLTLNLNIYRLVFIDRTHFDEQILNFIPKLTAFTVHICTAVFTSNTVQLLTTNDIQRTFFGWKYSTIACCVDYFSNNIGLCHIYSTPVKMTDFMYVTNSFRGSQLQFVKVLKLYDTRSFEHEFFEWTSRACPLVSHLIVYNLTPQKNQRQNGLFNEEKTFSIIKFLRLLRLDLMNAHVDYAYQFLSYTTTHLPHLMTLVIQYEQLVTVTNNFTNESTRINCAQLKRLLHDDLTVYPSNFSLYFPSLSKESC